LRSLGSVLLVCTGVIVMASSLTFVQYALAFGYGYWSPTHGLFWVLFWLPTVLAIAAGVVLIRKRDSLAARWFDESPVLADLGVTSLLRLALVIVGVVFVARAIPSFFWALTSGISRYSTSNESGGETTGVTWDWINALLGTIYPFVQLIVGITLVAVSKRLADRLCPDEAST
jgi:hypothetical protein